MRRWSLRWYRVWRITSSLAWVALFFTTLAEASTSVTLTVAGVALVIMFGPYAVGFVRGRLRPEDPRSTPELTYEPDQAVASSGTGTGTGGGSHRFAEWRDGLSDRMFAGRAHKAMDPVHLIAAAYRTATIRAASSGDLSHAVLRNALQQWSVPGAYDDPDSPRVRPAYDAWDLRMSQYRFRREMRRLDREGKWVSQPPRFPWDPPLRRAEIAQPDH